jgi:hypothetical protein
MVIAIVIIFIKKSSNFSNDIPKTIWTFWDSDAIPDSVKRCIDSWKKSNPDYSVIILNKNNLKTYLPEIDVFSLKHNDKPARTSDFVRLNILPKYGGVWADATIIINKPLSHIFSPQHNFTGFYLDGFTTNIDYPVIESWFFACTKGNDFVSKWRDAFMMLNNHETPDKYSEWVRNQGVDTQKINDLNYLAIHVAAQYVLQKEMTPGSIKSNLNILKAEDGPYKYLTASNWDSNKAVENLCKNKNLKDTTFIKLRGPERNILESRSNLKCIFD